MLVAIGTLADIDIDIDFDTRKMSNGFLGLGHGTSNGTTLVGLLTRSQGGLGRLEKLTILRSFEGSELCSFGGST